MISFILGATYIDDFHGVRIYESQYMGQGYGSGGVTLPGYGIIVGVGAYSDQLDMGLLRHEYGHILQRRVIGWLSFYINVGVPSLYSAWRARWDQRYRHQDHWVEQWANHLAKGYFEKQYWSEARFPSCDIEQRRLAWIKWRFI